MSNNLKGTDTDLDPSVQKQGFPRAPSLPMANLSRTHLIPDQGSIPFLLFSSSLLVLTLRMSIATLICLGRVSIQQAPLLWHTQTDTWLLGTVSGYSSHFLLAVHALHATSQTQATAPAVALHRMPQKLSPCSFTESSRRCSGLQSVRTLKSMV